MLTKILKRSRLLVIILLYALTSTAQVQQKSREKFHGFDEVKFVPYRQWYDMDRPWTAPSAQITNKDLDGKWVLTKARIWRGGPTSYLLNGQTKTNHKDTLEFSDDVITDPASNLKIKYHFTLSHNNILVPNSRKGRLDTTIITRLNQDELILSSGPDSQYSRRYYTKTH